MSTARRLALPVLGSIVVLVVLLAIHKLPTGRVLAIWVVLLTAIALRELVRGVPRGGGNREARFESVLRSGPTASPEAAVPRVERELQLSLAFADHAHRTLIPLLRRIAAARLSVRHGVMLERQPDVARRLLGEETWDLVRPDRPPPADGLGPGLREKDVAAAVARLESL